MADSNVTLNSYTTLTTGGGLQSGKVGHTPSSHLRLHRGQDSALKAISTILLARPSGASLVLERQREERGESPRPTLRRGHQIGESVVQSKPDSADYNAPESSRSVLKKFHVPLDSIPSLDLDNDDSRPRTPNRPRVPTRGLQDPLSPSLLPGAWNWASNHAGPSRLGGQEEDEVLDGAQDEAALLLPPPFLDDSSSKDSFSHLFDSRRPAPGKRPSRGPLSIASRYIAASVQQQGKSRSSAAESTDKLRAFLTKLLGHQAQAAYSDGMVLKKNYIWDEAPSAGQTVVAPAAAAAATADNAVQPARREEKANLKLDLGQLEPQPLTVPPAPSLRPMATPYLEDPLDPLHETDKVLKPVLKSAPSYTVSQPGLKKKVKMQDGEETIPALKLDPLRESKVKRSTLKLPRFCIVLLFGHVESQSPQTSYFKGVSHERGVSVIWRDVQGLVGLSTLILNFVLFVGAGLVDSIVTLFFALVSIYNILRWLLLNLSGRTDLSRAAVDYFSLIKSEWDRVADEDHEGRRFAKSDARARLNRLRRKGSQFARITVGAPPANLSRKRAPVNSDSIPRHRGLTLWQTFIGLVEWGCLQSMTKERWLENGAGLSKVVSEQDLDDDIDDEELLVTHEGDQILEGVLSPSKEISGMFQNWSNLTEAKDQARPVKKGNSLLSEIKRYARFSTSAYGLRTHILAPPTPLLTPGASHLPHLTYAHLTKTDPKTILHAAIQNTEPQDVESTTPYAPTYYLIVDRVHQCIIVAFRGTQSLHDIIVDLSARNDDLILPRLDSPDQTETYRLHAGILRAARYLVDRKESPLYSRLVKALSEYPDFGLVLTGHSLGAAIASTVAILISTYVPSSSSGTWVISDSSGLPPGRGIQAWTFAHPCTMDLQLAERVALGSPELVTGIALGADIICRMGSGQIRELRRILGALTLRRRERHRGGKLIKRMVGKESARESVLNAWWRWKRLGGGQRRWNDDVRSKEIDEIENNCWRLRQKIERDLFTNQSPSSLLSEGNISSPERRNSIDSGASSGTEELTASPVALEPVSDELEREERLRSAMLQSEAVKRNEGKDLMIPPGKMYWLNRRQVYQKDKVDRSLPLSSLSDWDLYWVQDPKRFFALPWFETCLLDEHMPLSYEEACSALRLDDE